MEYSKSLFLFGFALNCLAIFPVKTENSLKRTHEKDLDKLWKNIMQTMPLEEANSLVPKILEHPSRGHDIAVKRKKISLKASPLEEEHPTKKSDEAKPYGTPVALNIALMKSGVYLMKQPKGNLKLESGKKSEEFTANKRFNIPRSISGFKDRLVSFEGHPMFSENTPLSSEDSPMNSKHNSVSSEDNAASTDYRTTVSQRRIKREDDFYDASPTADAITDGTQIGSVPQFSAVIPTENELRDQEVNVRSGVGGTYANKLLAVVPMKVQTPMVVSAVPSVALTSTDPQEIQSSMPGTVRSILPITSLVQPEPRQPFKTPDTFTGSQVGNMLVKLQASPSDIITEGHQHVGELKFMAQPEDENPVIKLAHVPVHLLNSNTEDNVKAKKKSETETERASDVIDENTLKSLQLKLTSIISKLEEKVNKKEGSKKKEKKNKKEKVKTSNLIKTGKAGPSEKSLIFLKHKLARVLAKFNSKPRAGEPFTIGKEWSHLLDFKSFNQTNRQKKGGLLNKANTNAKNNEGNWPSIASQLLSKLNKALIKLQERKVARDLEKNAVMYFNFDKLRLSENSESLAVDRSGHFNDATLFGRAHVSSRTYGSCGKALILNSGNLHYVDKYFKNKPTKAISLAMWVRTNATGYVKWFARDTVSSREFSTRTQYPLVRKNVWTHLCGTFNTSTGITRIYVDGELKVEKVNKEEDTIPADFTPAGIGSKFGDDNLIAVDEVYIFSRALSEKEVKDLYDDCEFNRMVLHYGFQKINRSAGVVFDQSGLNNDAELVGGANILDSGCDKCGSCLELNSEDDPRLTIQGSQFKHQPSKAISLAAWLNLNSTTGTHPLFEATEPITGASFLDLRVTDGKLRWKGSDKNQNTIFNLNTEQSVVPEGIWVHILVSFDSVSGFAKIFVDGHQKALTKTAKKVPIGEDWGETRVGGKSVGSQASGGYIDEFVMYNWELDPSEISYVMKYCPDHPKLVSFTVHIPLD